MQEKALQAGLLPCIEHALAKIINKGEPSHTQIIQIYLQLKGYFECELCFTDSLGLLFLAD